MSSHPFLAGVPFDDIISGNLAQAPAPFVCSSESPRHRSAEYQEDPAWLSLPPAAMAARTTDLDGERSGYGEVKESVEDTEYADRLEVKRPAALDNVDREGSPAHAIRMSANRPASLSIELSPLVGEARGMSNSPTDSPGATGGKGGHKRRSSPLAIDIVTPSGAQTSASCQSPQSNVSNVNELMLNVSHLLWRCPEDTPVDWTDVYVFPLCVVCVYVCAHTYGRMTPVGTHAHAYTSAHMHTRITLSRTLGLVVHTYSSHMYVAAACPFEFLTDIPSLGYVISISRYYCVLLLYGLLLLRFELDAVWDQPNGWAASLGPVEARGATGLKEIQDTARRQLEMIELIQRGEVMTGVELDCDVDIATMKNGRGDEEVLVKWRVVVAHPIHNSLPLKVQRYAAKDPMHCVRRCV